VVGGLRKERGRGGFDLRGTTRKRNEQRLSSRGISEKTHLKKKREIRGGGGHFGVTLGTQLEVYIQALPKGCETKKEKTSFGSDQGVMQS